MSSICSALHSQAAELRWQEGKVLLNVLHSLQQLEFAWVAVSL